MKLPNCKVCNLPVEPHTARVHTFHRDCYLYWRTIEPSSIGYAILRYLKKYRAAPGVMQRELPFTRSAIQKATRKLVELGYVEKTDGLYHLTDAGYDKYHMKLKES